MHPFKIQLLPFAYATRNLLRDIPRLLQKIVGSGVVVFLILAAGAFNEGMKSLLRASGSSNNVVLLSAGSEESVERSEIDLQVESLAAAGIRGIESRLGQPAVSGEVHFMGALATAGGGRSRRSCEASRRPHLRCIVKCAFWRVPSPLPAKSSLGAWQSTRSA